MLITAAVPVKDFATAKTRLGAVLSGSERAALARTMLCDVLRALRAARLDEIWVVTADDDVAGVARAFAVHVLPEPRPRGHTAAVALAQTHAVRESDVFLTVPGDVPCLTADELDELIVQVSARKPMAVFAPSRSGRGTNGVALAPPAAMRLTFGEPSFANHLRAARHTGIVPRVAHLRGLALDIDAPDDLRALAIEGGATESGALAAAWRIGDRLTPTGTIANARESR